MFDVFLYSPFFYPEKISTGRYNTVLASSLVEAGTSVGVCASHPLYPDWRPSVSRQSLPGMTIFRGGSVLRYPANSLLRRGLLEFWFALHALWVTSRNRKKIKQALVVFPPNLFMLMVGLLLPTQIRKTGIVHDLQAGLGTTKKGLGKGLSKLIMWIEGRAFRSCDRLVFLSQAMQKYANSIYDLKGVSQSVFYPFATMDAAPAWQPCRLDSVLREDKVNVIYSGALGEKQAPDDLLEFLYALVANDERIHCHIFSRGQEFERLKRKCALSRKSGVFFHDLVSEEELPQLYLRSSVQVLPQRAGTSDFAFPSKLPNLLACGVPVFAITDRGSEVFRALDDYALGFSACSWDKKENLNLFYKFIETISSRRKNNNLNSLGANFSRKKLVKFLME